MLGMPWLWRPPTLKRGGPLRVTWSCRQKTEAEPIPSQLTQLHTQSSVVRKAEKPCRGGAKRAQGKVQESQRKCRQAWEGKADSRAAAGPAPLATGKQETCPGWKDSGEATPQPPRLPKLPLRVGDVRAELYQTQEDLEPPPHPTHQQPLLTGPRCPMPALPPTLASRFETALPLAGAP